MNGRGFTLYRDSGRGVWTLWETLREPTSDFCFEKLAFAAGPEAEADARLAVMGLEKTGKLAVASARGSDIYRVRSVSRET